MGIKTKVKTSFFCQSCGSQFGKWQGQCTSCKEWNTVVEEVIQKPEKSDCALGIRVKSTSEQQGISQQTQITFNQVTGLGLGKSLNNHIRFINRMGRADLL